MILQCRSMNHNPSKPSLTCAVNHTSWTHTHPLLHRLINSDKKILNCTNLDDTHFGVFNVKLNHSFDPTSFNPSFVFPFAYMTGEQ
jgi:hypothetical protein